jgi:hypothetical protein
LGQPIGSRVKKYKKKAVNSWYTVYVGKDVGGDQFSLAVGPAKRVDAV